MSNNAALAEIPIPHREEPHGPFSQPVTDCPIIPPSLPMQTHMSQLLSETARNTEWFSFSRSEIEDFGNVQPLNQPVEQWIAPFCGQLLSKLEYINKRPNSPLKRSSPRKTTPKRPRHPHHYPEQPSLVQMSPNTRLASRLQHDISNYPPNIKLKRAENITPPSEGKQAIVPPQSFLESRRPAPNPDAVDAREKRMHDIAKDIDLDDFNAFIEYLTRFIRLADLGTQNALQGTLLVTANVSRLAELRQRVDVFAKRNAMQHVGSRILSRVIKILHIQVAHCVEESRKLNKSQLSRAIASDSIPAVLCASTVLSILCAPGSPRSLLVEELLDDIVELLKNISIYIVFPLCDALYKSPKSNPKQNKNKNSAGANPSHSSQVTEKGGCEVSSDDNNFKPFEGRKSAPRRHVLKREEELFDRVYELLEGLVILHEREHFLSHSVVSQCANLCVQSLSVTGIERFQSRAISLTCTIFHSYPDHRLPILDMAREVISIVPAARKDLRCFKVPEDPISIRASTALVSQLLCISSAEHSQSGACKSESGQSPLVTDSWTKQTKRRHDRSVKMAVHILDPLLKRTCADRDPEFKAAFQALFEDLLLLYGRPEWPSAELMLQTLSVSVITRLRSSEEKTVYGRCICLDILGALAAKMGNLYGTDILKDTQQSVSFKVNIDRLESERETLLLYLNPQISLHFSCANSFYEAVFLADDQNVAKNLKHRMHMISEEKKKSENNDEETVLDGQDVNTHITEYALSSEAIQEVSKRRAERIASRRKRDEEISRSDGLRASVFIGRNRSFTAGFSTILGAVLEGLHDSAPTVRTKSIKALSAVDEACRGLLCLLPNVLHYVEASCRDISTLARDAALELLSRSLLQNLTAAEIQSEVSHVHPDGGGHQPDPLLMSNIFSIVDKRLCDTATSVRKRAIGIMRTVLSNALQLCEQLRSNTGTPIGAQRQIQVYEGRIVQICTTMVNRLEDPESTVKEAAERTLLIGLFGFDISQEAPIHDSGDTERANQLAHRLIGVFSRLHTSIHSSFISRVIHESLLIKHKALLASIVNAAVEQMHGTEAKMANLTGDRSIKELSKGEVMELRYFSATKVACSSVICAFADLDSALVTPHCRALAPSIKEVSGNITEGEVHCVQRILNVLEIGISAGGDFPTSFIEEVMHDIDIIVCTSPFGALEEAAVRCFCVIAKKSELSSCEFLVQRSAEAFHTFLESNIENFGIYCSENMPEKMMWLERNGRFALTRLGLLLRYGDFDTQFTENVYQILAKASNIVSVVSRRDTLARSAVRGLSHFLIRRRSFLQKGTRILVGFLNNGGDDEYGSELREPSSKEEKHLAWHSEGVKLYVLQGFHDLLRDEEERNSHGKPESSIESRKRKRVHAIVVNGSYDDDKQKAPPHTSPAASEKRQENVILAAEEDAEAGYLALSAQLMVPQLQRAVLSHSVSIRRIVANIFGLLVRQGLLLPATVVTSLFILLLDQDKRCREYAHRVVVFLSDRHAGMFASAALPAVRTCFEASLEVFSSSDSNANMKKKEDRHCRSDGSNNHEDAETVMLDKIIKIAIEERTGISLLSQALMSMRREQRRGVLECVMKEFDPRVSLRTEIDTENSNDTIVNVEEDARKSCDETTTKNFKHGIDKNSEAEDEDVGQISGNALDLYGAGKLCALPTLYFLAITLASIDYTSGAGIGGSLTQGGGTAAAEVKLKGAKEDVNELIGIATRVISNSGQTVLRVTKQVLRSGNASAEKRGRIGFYATRVSLLLLLKHHLKFERWKAVLSTDEVKAEEESSRGICRLPMFRPDGSILDIVDQSKKVDCIISEEESNKQMELFCRLMREDAIDERDVVNSAKKGRRKGKGLSSRRRSGKQYADESIIINGTNTKRKRATQRRACTTNVVYEADWESNSIGDRDFEVK